MGTQSCRKFLQGGLLGLRVRGEGQSLTFWEQLQPLVWSEMDQSQCCLYVFVCGHLVDARAAGDKNNLKNLFILYLSFDISSEIQCLFEKGFLDPLP